MDRRAFGQPVSGWDISQWYFGGRFSRLLVGRSPCDLAAAAPVLNSTSRAAQHYRQRGWQIVGAQDAVKNRRVDILLSLKGEEDVKFGCKSQLLDCRRCPKYYKFIDAQKGLL